MTEMWPVLEGLGRAEAARAETISSTQPPSVDIAPSPGVQDPSSTAWCG